MKILQELLDALPQTGKLDWIGLRHSHRGEVKSVQQARVKVGLGLEGDHRSLKTLNPDAKRQVTLIQAEHLVAVASMLGFGTPIDPSLTRRNLVVSGINLLALKDKSFSIGEVHLEYTGLCHPCTRMEEALGAGGYNAMRGHGGITARVLHGETIHIDDKVSILSNQYQ